MSAKEKIKEKIDKSETLGKVKGKLSKTNKVVIGLVIAAVAVALVAAVVINMNKGDYEVLFPGMTQEENVEVYAVLERRGISAKRNSEGEVMVPSKDYGDIMLDMSTLGYPKTTLPFNIFSDNTGFTTTEFEKKQYLLLNLQDRIERTLKDMPEIKNAIVTLNVPEDNTYVWEEEESDSTGSISVTMMPGSELSEAKVSAIKNLVANSVPRLLPENVTVVNAETMEEFASGNSVSEGLSGVERLDFETKVEDKLEKKIEKVLSLGYKPDDFRVSATVVIDYDKMITENLKYVPEEDGNGVVEHSEESTSKNAASGAGGVAGEENNTDTPTYNAQNNNNNGNQSESTESYKNMDYVISYIKRQIEKDDVKLDKATVAIAVNDNNLTQAKKAELIDAASKAANIAPGDIVLTTFQDEKNAAGKTSGDDEDEVTPDFLQKYGLWIIIGAGVLVVLLGLLVFLLTRRHRRRVLEEEQEIFANEQIAEQEILERAQNAAVQNAINNKKKAESPAEEVQQFAETNPEIIANMISSWLKEEDE